MTTTAKRKAKVRRVKETDQADRVPSDWQVHDQLQLWYSRRIVARLPEADTDQVLRTILLCADCEAWYMLLLNGDLVIKGTAYGRQALMNLVVASSGKDLLAIAIAVIQAALTAEDDTFAGEPPGLRDLQRAAGTLDIDFTAEWAPTVDDLALYGDNRLRKLPQGKQAPKDLTGESLAGWIADNWPAGSTVPKEFRKGK